MRGVTATTDDRAAYGVLSKVPEVTIWFWIIKVLCTTVGETAADYLNVQRNFGLTGTSVVTGVLLVVALVLQFAAKRYVPWRYWATVTLVSIFGTLVTDNLTDHLKVRLEVSAIVFSVLLAVTFVTWYLTDRTLSIHSIHTPRREAFYWLAVLVSFALGTAAGDLMAERLGLGYAVAGEIVAALVVVTVVLWRSGMNAILGFWVVYIFTRPLGASIGDFLSQPRAQGGLGLGTTNTSYIFLAAILAVVVFLTVTKIDTNHNEPDSAPLGNSGGLWQTAVYVGVLAIGATIFYNVRTNTLATTATASPATSIPAAAGNTATANTAAVNTAAKTKLGDLTTFRVITQDTLDKLNAGDQAGATKRVDDLEREWDKAQARLQPLDGSAWTLIDGRTDTVLRRLRSTSPVPATEKQVLTDLLTVLN